MVDGIEGMDDLQHEAHTWDGPYNLFTTPQLSATAIATTPLTVETSLEQAVLWEVKISASQVVP